MIRGIKKRDPSCLGYINGDDILRQLHGDYFMSYYKDPY